mmetsp:Transcript_93742/g.292096  ORF Transcript_93742/g.292096 Transcript_93742/m.292096 type:complete len:354 (+) Transcript_93742:162-1223(+)
MADPEMLHCKCGYTCGTKAALEKHILRFGLDNKDHCLNTGPLSPAGRPQAGPMLKLGTCELDTTAVAMSPTLSVTSTFSTVPNSPMTPVCSPALFRNPSPVRPTLAQRENAVRLLLVRHAQSANKCREAGQRASSDPELSDLGYDQAQALGRHLQEQLRGKAKAGRLRVVSSPMRRCLLTIRPAVRLLELPPEACLCHGACYEYGCAGRSSRGSTAAEIARYFPEFSAVGFDAQGGWDYAGERDKENEPECRERAARFIQWLWRQAEAEWEAAERGGDGPSTIVLTTHQTVQDLLCHLLVYGSADKWSYGDITNKLQNACITELFLHATGRATFGVKNEGTHLMSLRFRMNLE